MKKIGSLKINVWLDKEHEDIAAGYALRLSQGYSEEDIERIIVSMIETGIEHILQDQFQDEGLYAHVVRSGEEDL